LVFVDTAGGKDWKLLPRPVQNALSHKASGKYIPKTVVMDNALKECIVRVPYEEWKNDSKATRKVKDAIKKYEKENEETSDSSSSLKSSTYKPPAPLKDWTNSEGKTVKARFIKLNEDSVTLKTATGKQVDYPLDKLSSESQAQAKASADEMKQK